MSDCGAAVVGRFPPVATGTWPASANPGSCQSFSHRDHRWSIHLRLFWALMIYLGQVAVLQALLNIDKQRTLGRLRVATPRLQLP